MTQFNSIFFLTLICLFIGQSTSSAVLFRESLPQNLAGFLKGEKANPENQFPQKGLTELIKPTLTLTAPPKALSNLDNTVEITAPPNTQLMNERLTADTEVPSLRRLDHLGYLVGIGYGFGLIYDYLSTELRTDRNGKPVTLVKTAQTSKFFTDPCEVATLSLAPSSEISKAQSLCAKTAA